MKMRKVFAMMLMAVAASTAMVACDDDDDDDDDKAAPPIVGVYEGGKEGLKANFMGNPLAIPDVNWTIEARANDTILVTTSEIKELGYMKLSIKAYGKEEAADSTLYSAIVPIQNLQIAYGTGSGVVTLDSGTVSYRPATKTSFISAGGSIYTVVGVDPNNNQQPQYASLPFSVTLTGPKK